MKKHNDLSTKAEQAATLDSMKQAFADGRKRWNDPLK
jgi:hypothetical protein